MIIIKKEKTMSFTFNENNYEVIQENIEDKLISV